MRITTPLKRDGDEFYIELPDEFVKALGVQEGDLVYSRYLTKVDPPTEGNEVTQDHEDLPNGSSQSEI